MVKIGSHSTFFLYLENNLLEVCNLVLLLDGSICSTPCSYLFFRGSVLATLQRAQFV